MPKFLIAAILCFAFAGASAQETDNTPASRADIQTYFEAVHSRDSVNKMVDSMAKSMQKLLHEQYLKKRDKLPEDYEQRMAKQLDDMFKNMPFDEMMQATIPVYQRHFTKGDVYALLAFYSSPTGQKLLRDLPVITSESMEAMMPTLSRYLDEIQNKLQRETDQMINDAGKKVEQAPKN